MFDLYDLGVRKDGKQYVINGRKLKKAERCGLVNDPIYEAYAWGQIKPRRARNPYPPGRRHNAFADGANNPVFDDEMGDWHGRNE